MECLCELQIKIDTTRRYNLIKITGLDFVEHVIYDNHNNVFLDKYYNLIRRSKSKSLHYDTVKFKVYGSNSIRPHVLTVTRFDNGQFSASYH